MCISAELRVASRKVVPLTLRLRTRPVIFRPGATYYRGSVNDTSPAYVPLKSEICSRSFYKYKPSPINKCFTVYFICRGLKI